MAKRKNPEALLIAVHKPDLNKQTTSYPIFFHYGNYLEFVNRKCWAKVPLSLMMVFYQRQSETFTYVFNNSIFTILLIIQFLQFLQTLGFMNTCLNCLFCVVFKLGVQIVELCMATRGQNGGEWFIFKQSKLSHFSIKEKKLAIICYFWDMLDVVKSLFWLSMDYMPHLGKWASVPAVSGQFILIEY